MTTPNYPTWDRAADYEFAVAEAVEQMRTAITDDKPHLVVDGIDEALKALHQLRQAAISEGRRRSDAAMARAAGSREEVPT